MNRCSPRGVEGAGGHDGSPERPWERGSGSRRQSVGRALSIQTRCPESVPTVSMETLGKLDPRAPVCFGGQGHSQTSGGDGEDADDLDAKPEREHWTGIEAAVASGWEKRPPGGNRDVSILQKVSRPHA